MATHLDPCGKRILVKRDDKLEKIGSIYVPDTSKEQPVIGTILAIGEDVENPDLKPDVRIMFGKYAGTDLEIDREPRTIITEGDVLGIVTEVEATNH